MKSLQHQKHFKKTLTLNRSLSSSMVCLLATSSWTVWPQFFTTDSRTWFKHTDVTSSNSKTSSPYAVDHKEQGSSYLEGIEGHVWIFVVQLLLDGSDCIFSPEWVMKTAILSLWHVYSLYPGEHRAWWGLTVCLLGGWGRRFAGWIPSRSPAAADWWLYL